MKAYSLDLRERIVQAVEAGQSKASVAERFGVGVASVKRYVKRHEQGQLAASKRPGQKPWLDAAGLETLRAQVEQHPAWTLSQRATALSSETGIELKKSAVAKYLKRLGITHKKRALLPANGMNKSEKLTGKRSQLGL